MSIQKVRKRGQEKRRQRRAERLERFRNDMSQHLLLHLTGGVAALDKTSGGLSPAAAAIVNAGVPVPTATLQWAKWLSNNATHIAQGLQMLCFNYSRTSSSQLDAFNVQIQEIMKKMESFISMMRAQSTPAAMKQLEEQVWNFSNQAMDDMSKVVRENVFDLVNGTLSKVLAGASHPKPGVDNGTASSSEASQARFLQRAQDLQAVLAKPAEDRALQRREMATVLDPRMSGVWDTVQTVLSETSTILPSAVTALGDARLDVIRAAATFSSVFNVLQVRGPVVFHEISILYKTAWILYCVLLMPVSLAILGYAFWANGWCGEAQVYDDRFQPPKTFWERCALCRRACFTCCTHHADIRLCVWSFMISMEVFALLLFLVSIMFAILTGVTMFLVAGCSEIYVLGDAQVCSNTMKMVNQLLPSFSVGEVSDLNPLNEACINHNLLTCKTIREGLLPSAMFTVIIAFLACFFTFQLIFDAAIMHERAKWARLMYQFDGKDS